LGSFTSGSPSDESDDRVDGVSFRELSSVLREAGLRGGL
jgi:hypothetical protein